MSPRPLVQILLHIITLLMPLSLLAEGYSFTDYKVSVTVHPDNSYSVREDMDIDFTIPSHGIFRTIPTDVWVNRDTSEAQDHSESSLYNYHCKLTDLKANTELKIYDEKDCQDIRMGSADQELYGLQHFWISYTLHYPSDRVSVADLFFYSVLGVANDAPVHQFSFDVRFDQPVPESSLSQLQVFVGDLGSNADVASQVITTRSSQQISGHVSQLSANQAVTLYLPLPEGYFQVSTPWQSHLAWILSLLAIGLLAYVLYIELTRDNHVAAVVSFYPPKDINSAGVGTLIDCEVDDQDLISLIPWFANHGYLSIDQHEGNTILTKLQDLPDDAPQYQRTFFKGLFPNDKTTFDTSRPSTRHFGEHWLNAKSKLELAYGHKLNEHDSKSFKWLALAICVTAAAIACSSAVSGSFIFALVMLLLYFLTALVSYGVYADKTRYGSAWITLGVMVCLFIPFSGLAPAFVSDIVCELIYEFIGIDLHGVDYMSMQYDLYLPGLLYGGLIILCLVACLLSLRLGKLSTYRREHLPELLGLQEFIQTAEKDRLEMLLEHDEKYFYNMLPYALAFGLADRWADKFKELTIPPSDGYSPQTSLYDLARLHQTFSSSNVRHGILAEEQARAEAAARQRAKSGGSFGSAGRYGGGGRGYSGGGFGGGGSRRW